MAELFRVYLIVFKTYNFDAVTVGQTRVQDLNNERVNSANSYKDH